ncbi:MAG TPA: S8 family serine peptidase [Burkholderiales bacterium]|nr:S8 family serine peptidase [Burkholderiales bacterium]
MAAQAAGIAPENAVARLQAGQPIELIVEYESAEIERQAVQLRQRARARTDTPEILEFRRKNYASLKQQTDGELARPDVTQVLDYSHLPMAVKRFRSLAALNAFLADPGIRAIYEDIQLRPVDATSLALIEQPAVAAVGYTGAGTMVAVIDNGINYTLSDFGSCTAPGTPAGCHVAVSMLVGTATGGDGTHGSNVAAIALSVAPGTQIAMLDAFSGSSASTSNVIAGINWAIANQSTYHIAAINMSLGATTHYTSTCSSGNSYSTPVANARSAGISVVAASGNNAYTNGVYQDGIVMPACTPGVVSVGAVYDANWGGLIWGTSPNQCTDTTSAADKITCFSNSASYLTLLAPGALITAGGSTEGGTSQATPHVAGAIAVLRAAFPAETLDQTQARLTGSGVAITDPRNGRVQPRLDLLPAARPANDAFINRLALSGNSGATTGTSLLATKEGGEPNHAGNAGGHSVWWKWTPAAAGQVNLDTHGSAFDTLLAVYTGSSVAALTAIASNDNDGSPNGTSSVLFEAQAGVEYEIVVDGANGAQGAVALNWSLNTAAQANLSVSIAGPAAGTDGVAYNYTVTAANSGPQTATNVVVTLTLPAQASVVSLPSSCAANGSIITCALGALADGGSVPLTLQITWNNANGTESLSAGISSDLPDPVPADNTAGFQALVQSSNQDIPALPLWSQWLLAAALLMSLASLQRKSAR